MEPNIDFLQWGMVLIHKDDFKLVYSQDKTDSKYIFYSLYPGIEIMLTLLISLPLHRAAIHSKQTNGASGASADIY